MCGCSCFSLFLFSLCRCRNWWERQATVPGHMGRPQVHGVRRAALRQLHHTVCPGLLSVALLPPFSGRVWCPCIGAAQDHALHLPELSPKTPSSLRLRFLSRLFLSPPPLPPSLPIVPVRGSRFFFFWWCAHARIFPQRRPCARRSFCCHLHPAQRSTLAHEDRRPACAFCERPIQREPLPNAPELPVCVCVCVSQLSSLSSPPLT